MRGELCVSNLRSIHVCVFICRSCTCAAHTRSACSSPSVLHIPTDFGARAPAHLDSRSTETCCGCGIAASWPHQSVYRPARTPGCPVLRVCCLPPVWSRVPRFFAGSDPQGHAATMLLYHTATLPVLSRDEHDRFTMLLYPCCQGASMTVLPCCSTTLLPCPRAVKGRAPTRSWLPGVLLVCTRVAHICIFIRFHMYRAEGLCSRPQTKGLCNEAHARTPGVRARHSQTGFRRQLF